MIQALINATILAIIEGITEFLPISSTGHLILAENCFSLQGDKSFQDTFLVVIQFPAILAVLLYFYKILLPPLNNNKEATKNWFFLWIKIGIAFIPAGILGFLLDDIIDYYLFNTITVLISLIIGGLILIWIEKFQMGGKGYTDVTEVTVIFCLLVGLFQCIAMIPGVSRSAATIIGAMILGATRGVAVEFSFYLAIPTLAGAGVLKLLKHGLDFTLNEWFLLLIGSVVSFFVAYLVIAFFLKYIKTHDFKIFGVYRICLGVIILLIYYLI